MAKSSKKAPTFQYGIQITKPHSSAMYDHNDKVAEVLKSTILSIWEKALKNASITWENNLEEDQKGLSFFHDASFTSEDDSHLAKLSKAISFTGYGSGFTIEDVNDDFKNDLENMPNWQLHECYGEMKHDGLVPQMEENISYGASCGAMMVGFPNEYYYGSVYNTYDCYEDQLTDELEKVANPNYSNPKYKKATPEPVIVTSYLSPFTGSTVECSKALDNEMANESENIQ